jgi:hypothetical protein
MLKFLRRISRLLRRGWHFLAEVHTAIWVLSILGISTSAGGAGTFLLAYAGEHSAALLVMAFCFIFLVVFLSVLALLGFRQENKRPADAAPAPAIGARQYDMTIKEAAELSRDPCRSSSARPPQ